MNASTIIKLIIGLVATAVWGAALVGKHFWPDLDTSAIVLACGSALTGLGIYHVASPDGSADKPADKAQGGFISSRMFAAVASVALGLSMLAGCAGLNAQGVLTITYNTPQVSTSATLFPGGLAAILPSAPASAPVAAVPAAAASAAK